MPNGEIAKCYAKEVALSVAIKAYDKGFEHHYWRPHALRSLAARNKEPKLIFVDSMSDLFAPNVPEDQVRQCLDAMRGSPHHTYQSLTKAPPQLLKYKADLPPNLWVGVSSPPDFFMGKEMTHKKQVAMLRKSLEVLAEIRAETPCLVWMSLEPVSWDLAEVIDDQHELDWAVIGAASSGRQYFQPEPDHVARLLDVFDATHTPVFYKGNIGKTFEDHNFGSEDRNRWREDFPTHHRDMTAIRAVACRQEACRQHGWTESRVYIPRGAIAA